MTKSSGSSQPHPPSIPVRTRLNYTFAGYVAVQKCSQLTTQRLEIVGPALPHHVNAPASLPQPGPRLCVPRHVAVDLLVPERCIPSWSLCSTTPLVPMPEASVHENHRPVFRQHNIGTPGEIPSMQPVPITHRMQHRPHNHLRPRVLVSHARHDLTALLAREHIGSATGRPRLPVYFHFPHVGSSPSSITVSTSSSSYAPARAIAVSDLRRWSRK